jgi:hypothetical protein
MYNDIQTSDTPPRGAPFYLKESLTELHRAKTQKTRDNHVTV